MFKVAGRTNYKISKKSDKAKNDERFKDKKTYGVFRMFTRLFKKNFMFNPLGMSMFLLFNVTTGFLCGFSAKIQQVFYDAAGKLIEGSVAIKVVIFTLIGYITFNLANELLNSFTNIYFSIYTDRVNGINQRELNLKLGRLTPISFEDTEVLDDITKASQGMYASVYFVLQMSLTFVFYIPYLVVMSWYLITLKPILIVAMIIAFIPSLFSQFLKVNIYTKLEDKSAPKRREMDYYENCCTSRNLFKETRVLGAFSYFNDLYKNCLKNVQQLAFKAYLKTALLDFSMNIVSAVGYLGVLFLAFKATMDGSISIGAFVAIINSLGMLFGIIGGLVGGQIGNITKDLGLVRNYVRVLEMQEHGGKDEEKEKEYDIVLKNVSFSYPLKKKEADAADEKKPQQTPEEPVFALKDINLTIKNGETIAIVGENGSGKSTLVRLITGMYRPVEGDVYLGSRNTKDLTLENTFKGTSGVFQKYQRYQITLSENISVSQTEKKAENEFLQKVCVMAGVNYEDKSFPQGFETMLSREFDGVDLSGGQWQRVAIARGFFRDHDMIVLDEPTAAIDPFEEKNIYDRFSEISKQKTAVIVTHRLGSVKLADKIVMMEKGRIIGCGSHKELYASCPEYAVLWDSQAETYK